VAKEWLTRARAWIEESRQPTADGEARKAGPWDQLPWTERVALEVLLAEAESLLSGEAKMP
jgi:hypothetical protein